MGTRGRERQDMIYGRGGDVVTLVRVATEADIVKCERRKVDKQDKERFGYGMLWMARYPEQGPGEEWPVDLAFLKADNGWCEIDDARKALVTPEQYAEWTGTPLKV